ncbi:DUF1707 domain-containing protein [Streptomyces sp. CAU 1734]|uniref:DUF1707 SHOCT-like domain-containing protein n=1 Tax=Streptomyces sp. CAU 1734 TaxID=3140360 RepID=UPI0032606908
MSELPEMRASDSERERVAERLRDAVAEGRLTMEEFEERLDATYQARTHGELVPLVRDLPAPGGGTAAPAPLSSGRWADRIGGTATSRMGFSFWSGFRRRGAWTVPRVFSAYTVMGGGELDLREARFEDGDVVIRCFALMGGIEVILPPELNAQVTGFAFMGGFDESGEDEEPDPAAPRVRVTGFALMAGVDVVRKRTKAEKQRLKAERERARLERGKGGETA